MLLDASRWLILSPFNMDNGKKRKGKKARGSEDEENDSFGRPLVPFFIPGTLDENQKMKLYMDEANLAQSAPVEVRQFSRDGYFEEAQVVVCNSNQNRTPPKKEGRRRKHQRHTEEKREEYFDSSELLEELSAEHPSQRQKPRRSKKTPAKHKRREPPGTDTHYADPAWATKAPRPEDIEIPQFIIKERRGGKGSTRRPSAGSAPERSKRPTDPRRTLNF